jgi:hypothetical protein
VSVQIHAPGALSTAKKLQAFMSVWAFYRMIESMSLMEIDPNIPGMGPIA